ncbi:5-hydroxytryptamine receptor 3A-like [Pelobates cultripes]|uniref:5-hydroxytryptamine receptor 3A-like n=1 Tax=Pelobates cultripes TaxID=61616 RepID=A0AAD1WQP1_PELCU|nr:5-hydroxytryptamine receptor 3A-like [Pelobates cultripes]
MLLVISLLITSTFLGIGQCQQTCDFIKLQKSLENGLSITVRPTNDWGKPTYVFVNINLHSIVEMNMNLQTLTTYILFQMTWRNDFISWNASDFCGIDYVIVPDSTFWKPDLYIYELIESSETDDKPIVIPYYIVYNYGDLTQFKPLRIVSTCTVNIFKFPFDTQTCDLTLGSFVYSVNDILMAPSSNSTTVTNESKQSFSSKGDWDLISITVHDKTVEYDDGERFDVVKYEIKIKRTPLNYVINLIIPAVLMLFVDICSMFIQSYEDRLAFKITVVLGFSVLLLILNDMLPNSDTPPILGVFFCVCMGTMIFSIAGCVCSSYLMKLSYEQSKVPTWMNNCFLRNIARVMFVKCDGAQKDLETVHPLDRDCYNNNNTKIKSHLPEKRKKFQKKIKPNPEIKLLRKILAEIVKIHEKWNTSIDQDNVKSEWYTAAVVFDRLIVIVYLIIVITMVIVLIISWTQ